MKIKLVKIGKLTLPVKELVDTYAKRLQAYAKLDLIYLKGLDQAEKLLDEPKGRAHSYFVLLDERGRQFSSPALADFIRLKSESSTVKNLYFIVGGPFGLGDSLRQRADLIWSLSEAVFPSDLAWLLLSEQIYRAYNIMQGTPYHHE